MSDRDIMESRARYVEEKIAQAKSDEFKALTAELTELKHQVGLLKMERSIDQEEVTGHREAERLLALERDALKKELAVMKKTAERMVEYIATIDGCEVVTYHEGCEQQACDTKQFKACIRAFFTAKAREEQTPTRVICIQCHGCKSVDGKTPCELCGGKGYVELPKARGEGS